MNPNSRRIFQKYAPKEFKVQSVETKSISEINPISIEAMKKLGIDISTQKSKEITDEMIRNSEYIINMGCIDKSSVLRYSYQKL